MLNICRLCLRKKEEPLKDIITSTLKCSELSLIDCLYWVFGVEVDASDPFPKLICLQCLGVIKYVGNFRQVFQKNQIVLKEKINHCLNETSNLMLTENVDASVDNTVKDVDSPPEKRNTNCVTLATDQFTQPTVVVLRLEDSSVYNEYEKIHDTLFKKKTDICKNNNVVYNRDVIKIVEDKNASGNNNVVYNRDVIKIVEDENDSGNLLSIDNFQKFSWPILRITRLEDSNIYKDYEQIDNTFYKKIVNLDEDDVTEEARELGPLTKAVSNKHVKVLIDEFKHFSSPSLIIPRLEESNICEEYDKIDDITYKEICGNVDVNSDLTTNNTRRMNFIEYYYRTPTSALRELIKERNEIISGRTFDTCPTKPIVNDKSQPLFKVDNVLYVEVCNYCSKVFKTKQLLNIHYNMYHRMLSKQEGNKKKIVKGKKRRKKKKFKWSRPKLHPSLIMKKTEEITSNREKPAIISNILLNGVNQRWFSIGNKNEHKNFTSNYELFPNLKFVKEQSKENGLLPGRKRKVKRTNMQSERQSKILCLGIQETEKSDHVNLENGIDQEIESGTQDMLQLQSKEKRVTSISTELCNSNHGHNIGNNSNICTSTDLYDGSDQRTDNIAEDTRLQIKKGQFDDLPQLSRDLACADNINFENKKGSTLKRNQREHNLHHKKKRKRKRVITKKAEHLQNTEKQNINCNITELSGLMSLIEIGNSKQATGSMPANDNCHFKNKEVQIEEQQPRILSISGNQELKNSVNALHRIGKDIISLDDVSVGVENNTISKIKPKKQLKLVRKQVNRSEPNKFSIVPYTLERERNTAILVDISPLLRKICNKKSAMPSDLTMPSLEKEDVRTATPSDLTMPLLEPEGSRDANTVPSQKGNSTETILEDTIAIQTQLPISYSRLSKVVKEINSEDVPEICSSKIVENQPDSCNPKDSKGNEQFELNKRDLPVLNLDEGLNQGIGDQDRLTSEGPNIKTTENESSVLDVCGTVKEVSELHNNVRQDNTENISDSDIRNCKGRLKTALLIENKISQIRRIQVELEKLKEGRVAIQRENVKNVVLDHNYELKNFLNK